MGIGEKLAIGIVCAFLLLGVIRLFSTPLRLALKVVLNTALGFAALFILQLAEPLLGVTLGLNLFNAVVIGILGLPGLVLLGLLQMVFI